MAVWVLLLAGLLLILPVRADGGTAAVSSTTCTVGEEVAVTRSVSEPFNGGNISVFFDGNRLEYVGCTAENTSPNLKGSSIHLATLSMDTDLHQMSYTWIFRAIAEGSASVGISSITLSDSNKNPISIATLNEGRIVISPKSPFFIFYFVVLLSNFLFLGAKSISFSANNSVLNVVLSCEYYL